MALSVDALDNAVEIAVRVKSEEVIPDPVTSDVTIKIVYSTPAGDLDVMGRLAHEIRCIDPTAEARLRDRMHAEAAKRLHDKLGYEPPEGWTRRTKEMYEAASAFVPKFEPGEYRVNYPRVHLTFGGKSETYSIEPLDDLTPKELFCLNLLMQNKVAGYTMQYIIDNNLLRHLQKVKVPEPIQEACEALAVADIRRRFDELLQTYESPYLNQKAIWRGSYGT